MRRIARCCGFWRSNAAGSATGVCARWPNARGGTSNLKKVYRLYREEGLTVRRRRGRKRALGTRAPLKAAAGPNDIWVLDFMSDMLETGRRFRVFAVEDQLTRRGLVAEVDTSLPGRRVVRVLDGLVAEHGRPAMIVSDNGTELTCNAILKWTEDNDNGSQLMSGGKLGSRSVSVR